MIDPFKDLDREQSMLFRGALVLLAVFLLIGIGRYILQEITLERKAMFLLTCSTMNVSEKDCLALYELPK